MMTSMPFQSPAVPIPAAKQHLSSSDEHLTPVDRPGFVDSDSEFDDGRYAVGPKCLSGEEQPAEQHHDDELVGSDTDTLAQSPPGTVHHGPPALAYLAVAAGAAAAPGDAPLATAGAEAQPNSDAMNCGSPDLRVTRTFTDASQASAASSTCTPLAKVRSVSWAESLETEYDFEDFEARLKEIKKKKAATKWSQRVGSITSFFVKQS